MTIYLYDGANVAQLDLHQLGSWLGEIVLRGMVVELRRGFEAYHPSKKRKSFTTKTPRHGETSLFE